MMPLIVLLAAFFLSLLLLKWIHNQFLLALAGRIAMSVMLFFTAVGHFVFTEGMALMIPSFVPFKQEMVYFTGVVEIAGAVGLLVPRLSTLTAWLLISFFILVLPANIYAALQHVDYQNATVNGQGPDYLWFRIPLQFLFIIWVYLSVIRK
jgi:uncharacterized membrane protein